MAGMGPCCAGCARASQASDCHPAPPCCLRSHPLLLPAPPHPRRPTATTSRPLTDPGCASSWRSRLATTCRRGCLHDMAYACRAGIHTRLAAAAAAVLTPLRCQPTAPPMHTSTRSHWHAHMHPVELRGAGRDAGQAVPREPAVPHRPLPGAWGPLPGWCAAACWMAEQQVASGLHLVRGAHAGPRLGMQPAAAALAQLGCWRPAAALHAALPPGAARLSLVTSSPVPPVSQGKEMTQNLFVMRFANM